MVYETIQNLAFQRASAQIASSPVGNVALPPMSIANVAANNPFLISNNMAQPANRQIGVNKPFYKPMFLGYRDEEPQYGGARLFVLA